MKSAYEKYSEIRDRLGYTDYKVAKDTGIGTATISNWKNGKYMPKDDKLRKIAAYLGVTVDSFKDNSKEDDNIQNYYLNEETAKVAQEIFENKELRLLFSAARDASPEDLKTTHDLLLALKRKERGYSDDTGA